MWEDLFTVYLFFYLELPWWLRKWRIFLKSWRLWFDPWVTKIPWKGGGYPSSILVWRTPWTEEPGSPQWTDRLSRLAGQAGFPKARYGRRLRNKTQEFSEKHSSGTNTAPKWRCGHWVQAGFIILSAVKERMCRALSDNSCALQDHRAKWSLTTE